MLRMGNFKCPHAEELIACERAFSQRSAWRLTSLAWVFSESAGSWGGGRRKSTPMPHTHMQHTFKCVFCPVRQTIHVCLRSDNNRDIKCAGNNTYAVWVPPPPNTPRRSVPVRWCMIYAAAVIIAFRLCNLTIANKLAIHRRAGCDACVNIDLNTPA